MSVKFLKSSTDQAALNSFSLQTSLFAGRNVFNPSIKYSMGYEFIAFRALPADGKKPFSAFFYFRPTNNTEHLAPIINLTEYVQEFGVKVVADPKILVLDQDVFVTFNTGQPAPNKMNSIYLMQVFPKLGPPQICRLESGQNFVEKNWAFFNQSNTLALIYSLSPYIVARLKTGRLGTLDELVFRAEFDDSSTKSPLGSHLSIGTQLEIIKNDAWLIAHEKVGFRSHRAYFGRLVHFEFSDGNLVVRNISKRRLAHSFATMLPHKPAHNPSLISCTYFAGMSLIEDTFKLSYGVNDVSYNLVSVERSDLW